MAKSYFLTRFEKKRPHHEHSQESILEWLAKAHSYSEAISQRLSSEQKVQFQEKIKSDLFKLGLGKGKIEKRGIQFDDFTHEDWDEMRIFKLNENYKGLGLKEKSKLFEQETSKIFESFYPNAESLPSYLIHVSCTGYASPSAAQKIVSKHFRRETHVTHAYHMGCYAALPSIRMGLFFAAFRCQRRYCTYGNMQSAYEPIGPYKRTACHPEFIRRWLYQILH
jgi:hypothetical protein